jgi:YHS domain-containing protein
MWEIQMKRFVVVVGIFLGLSAFANSRPNLDKNGIALSGFDPVSYFKANGPQKGLAKFQAERGEAKYFFANEEDKQEFLKNPAKYTPQFDGYCAYAVADSKSKVEVDPKSFVVQDGRLLLFYNGFLADTRDKWLHQKNKDSKTFLKEADANWIETKNKDPK